AKKPVSDVICAAVTKFKVDRGARWADGEVQYGVYDHHYPPNPKQWDCIALEYSWKAARSQHSSGVNLAMADGSVHFISDNVDINTWRAMGTIMGNDYVGDY